MSARPVPTWVGGAIPNGRYHCVERNYYGGTAPSGMFQETLEITGNRIEQSIAIEQGVLMLMQTSTMMYTANVSAFSITFACGGSTPPMYAGYSVVTQDAGPTRLLFGVRSGEATLVSTYELQ